jgi:hypothetical protein
LRLNLGGRIRKTSPARRSRSIIPNRPPLSAQAQARSILSTSSTESLSPSSRDPAQPATPLWKKSLSLLSSYIDPDEHRVPAPQEEEEEEEEEKDNNDDKIKGIKEINKETRRIYILYNINFITKLNKDIYYSDIFIYNKFNTI